MYFQKHIKYKKVNSKLCLHPSSPSPLDISPVPNFPSSQWQTRNSQRKVVDPIKTLHQGGFKKITVQVKPVKSLCNWQVWQLLGFNLIDCYSSNSRLQKYDLWVDVILHFVINKSLQLFPSLFLNKHEKHKIYKKVGNIYLCNNPSNNLTTLQTIAQDLASFDINHYSLFLHQ